MICQAQERERNYGLGMDALIIVCSWNTNGIMVWAWMLWSSYALGTGRLLRFGHGCSDHRMLLEHERNYGLGMDALVIVCSWNTNGIMVWACMLWSSYALGTGTLLWFGHGCSGHGMLCGRLHMAAPTLEPHQLQRNLVGTTERRVHEAASHQKQAQLTYCFHGRRRFRARLLAIQDLPPKARWQKERHGLVTLQTSATGCIPLTFSQHQRRQGSHRKLGTPSKEALSTFEPKLTYPLDDCKPCRFLAKHKKQQLFSVKTT